MNTLTRLAGFTRTLVKNRHAATGLPRFLTYTVTFGCNARCIMCDSWKLPVKGDLTVDEFDRIARQLPQLDAVRLTHAAEVIVLPSDKDTRGVAEAALCAICSPMYAIRLSPMPTLMGRCPLCTVSAHPRQHRLARRSGRLHRAHGANLQDAHQPFSD